MNEPVLDPAPASEAGRSTASSLYVQLERFAGDVGELYRGQKERSHQLEEALDSLRVSYRETVRSMAYVVEAVAIVDDLPVVHA